MASRDELESVMNAFNQPIDDLSALVDKLSDEILRKKLDAEIGEIMKRLIQLEYELSKRLT